MFRLIYPILFYPLHIYNIKNVRIRTMYELRFRPKRGHERLRYFDRNWLLSEVYIMSRRAHMVMPFSGLFLLEEPFNATRKRLNNPPYWGLDADFRNFPEWRERSVFLSQLNRGLGNRPDLTMNWRYVPRAERDPLRKGFKWNINDPKNGSVDTYWS